MFKMTKSIPLLTEIANREDLTLAEAVVYSALRFKLNLSLKTGFKDQDGVHYVVHEQKEIMNDTGLSKTTVQDAMKKLESEAVGLIRRVKLGRSFKIYFNQYEVDEKYIIAEKSQNDAQDVPNEIDPSNLPQESQEALDGLFSTYFEYVDNSVDNSVNSLGIISCMTDSTDLIGAEFVPNDLLGTENVPNANMIIDPIGTESAPNCEIGTESVPYNKNLYKKNYKPNNISSINNFTLLKKHQPTIMIDVDLYNAYNQSFDKKITKGIKNAINKLVARGVDKALIINVMTEIGERGWSWGTALNRIEELVNEGIKTLDQRELAEIKDVEVSDELLRKYAERPKYDPSYIQSILVAEKSEWKNAEQMAFAQ